MENIKALKAPRVYTNGANVFCFLSSLPLLTPSHNKSVWLLPTFSTLPKGAGLPMHMIGEVS
jgi:hypothetical protein